MRARTEHLNDWLAQVSEAALEPELPVIDAHHHLWPTSPIPEFAPWGVAEAIEYKSYSGHNIVATVHVEAHTNYRQAGQEELRCVGETEFVERAAETAEQMGGRAAGLCAGIVGAGDMLLGAGLDKVLAAHQAASPGRFRGIRFNIANDPDWVAPKGWELEAGLSERPEFRAAFEKLAARGLSFDTWIMHPQLGEVAELADAFPETTIVISHVGSPMGIGRFRDGAGFEDWRARLAQCAEHPNIMLKLGGLHLSYTGLGVPAEAPRPRTSSEMADAHGPHIVAAIEIMGASRCMFESNFPVDGMQTSGTVLWNAFKQITADIAPVGRRELFSGSAIRAYRLDLPAPAR